MDDRIEVDSPGGLMPGLTLADIVNGVSEIRNPALARVFSEMNLMEEWGSGLRGVVRKLAEAGLPAPEFVELPGRLRVIVHIPNHQASIAPKPGTTRGAHSQSEHVSEHLALQPGIHTFAILTTAPVAPARREELLSAVGLTNAYGNYKRNLVPLVGAQIVVATVPEADRQSKPVRVKRTGKGYLRQHDGDYPLSDLEDQAFIAQRTQPVFDQQPVSGAKPSDLDQAAVARYLEARRQASPRLGGVADDELVVRLGVLTEDHIPTLAGLLAFGIYPQQFLPNTGIQASLLPLTRTSTIRALESVYFSGPIPAMLEDTVAWVGRVTGRSIIEDQITGQVRDISVFPPIAVRELVANALVHRDYGPYALSMPVILQVTTQTLTIANQGGLLGVTVESLGRTPSHLRNPRLAEILQSVASPTGVRVIERLGSGIPAVREVLADAGLPAPEFIDQGVRFTAKISTAPTQTAPDTPHDKPQDPRSRLLSAIAKGQHTTAELATATGLSRRQVTYTLASLMKQGVVTRTPANGREYNYLLPPVNAPGPSPTFK